MVLVGPELQLSDPLIYSNQNFLGDVIAVIHPFQETSGREQT